MGCIGPLWGGGIAELIGWRGVFWINLPMCLPLALAGPGACLATRRREASATSTCPARRLLGASLVCLTIALTDDPIDRATQP